MPRKPNARLLSCLVAVASTATALDATAAEPVREDDEMVVTATRTERRLQDVPASVTVISAGDIEKSVAQSADELLQDLAGIDVKHSMGALSIGTSNQVTMRGMGGLSEARTLLLIDGVAANEIYNGAVEWNQIPVEDIQRIEVVRGATSALYGSNAMGGVINIITKRPTEAMTTTVKVGYGDLGTKSAGASLSGSSGRLGYYLSGHLQESDGYQPLPDDKLKATSIDKGQERSNFRGRLSYALSPTSSVSLTARRYDAETTGTYDIPDYTPFDQETTSFTADYENRLGGGRTFSATVYNKTEDSLYDGADWRGGYTSVEKTSANEQDNIGGTLQYTTPFFNDGGADHVLTGGIDLRQGEFDRHDDYISGRDILVSGTQRYAGLFLQDEVFLTEDLVLNAGGRYDYWKNYDGSNLDTADSPVATEYESKTHDSFSPKLGATYHVSPRTTLRGSVGKAFRAPSLYDLYRTYITTYSVYASNPDLDPEKVLSYEVGVEHRITPAASIAVTLYRSDAEDYIATITPDPENDPYYHEKANVGEVEIYGAETEFRYRITPAWSMAANFTYNRTTIQEYGPDPSLEGNFLPDTPTRKANLSVTYSDPEWFTAKATARHIGQRYDNDSNSAEHDAYTLVDLHLSKEFGGHYRFALNVDDLFDETFTEYYVSPGRVVTGELTATY